MKKGRLYLIPTVIAEGTEDTVIPPQVRSVLPSIKHFLAEDIRTARRFLSQLKIYGSIEELNFSVLNKDTPQASLRDLFTPLEEGHALGILSESGCPGIADPGAMAVRYAHEHGFDVVPLVGPSSILLALMASGLNGQHFAFHGYLPIDQKAAAKMLQELEKESKKKNQTQIFIETPYRNNQLMAVMLKTLNNNSLLSISIDVTGSHESIRTLPVRLWKNESVSFPKAPAIFMFLAEGPLHK